MLMAAFSLIVGNRMSAIKISFMNEMPNIVEQVRPIVAKFEKEIECYAIGRGLSGNNIKLVEALRVGWCKACEAQQIKLNP